jgi:hypothetical protein
MNIFDLVVRKLHIHVYGKPVVSMYRSFNYRDVIFECRCGKRIIKNVRHDEIFPFETAYMIDRKEFEQYLTNNKYYCNRFEN